MQDKQKRDRRDICAREAANISNNLCSCKCKISSVIAFLVVTTVLKVIIVMFIIIKSKDFTSIVFSTHTLLNF